MMRIILFCVIVPLAWSYGEPNSRGGGAFAYVDSSGHRYGGTYGLKDGKVVSSTGDAYPVPFAEDAYSVPFADNFYQGDDFGSFYFANLENILQEAFKSSIANQRLAFSAARKAFDLTSNQAGGFYPNPNIASRFPAYNNFPPGFPFTMQHPMPNFPNSAYAGAFAGPGYSHQMASIFPENSANPNVDAINHYSDRAVPNNGNGYFSVSSNSFSSSTNVDGKETNNRGAETVVNDNGKITKYKVHS